MEKIRQIGANLPIVMGTSFAFVPTASAIGAASGIGAVLGGCLAGSMIEVLMGFFYKYIRRFFPPLVVGCTLVTIGVNLLDVGVDYFAGGSGAEDYGSIQNPQRCILCSADRCTASAFRKRIIKKVLPFLSVWSQDMSSLTFSEW